MDCPPSDSLPPPELTWTARSSQRVAFVAIPAVALVVASCGGGQAPEIVPLGFPVTVERSDGQELTFEKPPQRIASLSPAHTEVLFAIGAGDQVIAVDTQSDFPRETEEKTKIDAMSPDLEAVDELEPDLLVILAGTEGRVQSLDDRGHQVLWLGV